jgi:ribonuclease R
MIPRDIMDKEAILHFMRTKTSRPLSSREIATALGFSKREFRSLKRILKSLVKSGDIFKTRRGIYCAIDDMSILTGFFEAHRDGYGFVVPDRTNERDIFIPPRKTHGAMSGDRVVAVIEDHKKREGRIIRIIERAQKKVVGRLCYGKNFYYLEPKGRRIPFYIHINPGQRAGARKGDMVVVEIMSYPSVSRIAEGKVLKVMPEIDEPKKEIDMIMEEYSLTAKFPPSVTAEVRGLDESRSIGISQRKRIDCRHLLTVTIDGEKAKDFDDAVSIEMTDWGFILWVHIADVSHYVSWDSAIDLEARRRGTSFYAPDRVIPMLPKELSNNLCSLLPRHDRLTFTVEMHFDKEGVLIKKDFYPSIITSNERMTYTSVTKILMDNDHVERKKYGYLIESFEVMAQLCELLRHRRIRRGSLDFDLPEPEVLLDIQGRPEAIIKSERSLSHMIIEEFMIAANEAVASYLEDLGVPTIYRIHEEPDVDKINGLLKIFNKLGLRIKKTGIRAFHEILKKVKGRVEESFVNTLVLRSMKQAKYSTVNIGHFGLASKTYTHFTSPIRRYPDLVVHRILKDSIRGRLSEKRLRYLENVLPEIAFLSSRAERIADEAEREVLKAMRVWFMKDKVGEEYEGFIIDITPYGLRIQLRDIFVEGFLPLSYMTDDYYRFDRERYCFTARHSRKTYTIGNELVVRVERVDIEGREVFFSTI